MPEERRSHGRLLPVGVDDRTPHSHGPGRDPQSGPHRPPRRVPGLPRRSPVVGATEWLPALDVGLVVKQDADEAWAALRYARRAIVVLGGATIGAARASRDSSSPAPGARRRRATAGSDRSSTTPRPRWRARAGRRLPRGEPGLAARAAAPGVAGPRPAGRGRAALRGGVPAPGPRAPGARSGRAVEATEDWTVDGAVRHFLTVVFPVRGEANAQPRASASSRPTSRLRSRASEGSPSSPATSSAWSRSAPRSSRPPRSAAGSSSAR